MPNTYRIQVQTVDQTKWGVYSDSQYLVAPMDMTLNDVMVQYGQQIEDEKNARIQRWGDSIDNPVVPAEPTESDLIAQKQALQDQLDQLTAQTVEIDSKIQAIEALKIQPIGDVVP